MHALFCTFFPVLAVQKLLKSVNIWQSGNQMYTATFYKPRQKSRFWFFQVRCTHRSGDVVNFVIVACRISSRLKWYKKYKNWLRLAKVIVKNKMSRFLWLSVYLHQVMSISDQYHALVLGHWHRDTLYFLNLSWFSGIDFIKNVKYTCDMKFMRYMCAKNYQNRAWSDKVIAKKCCSFFWLTV